MMNRDRAETLWGGLSSTQRIALNRMLDDTFSTEIWRKHWSDLKEHEKEALLRLDWDISLGVRFPDFRA